MTLDTFFKKFDQFADAPDAVAKMRELVLDLAVRGKLSNQNSTEKPPVIGDENSSNHPYRIPENWAWTTLDSIAELITSGSRGWAKYCSPSGPVFITMGNLSRGSYALRLGKITHVRPPSTGEGTRTRLQAHDIVISITGDVGNLGLVPDGFGEAYINQHCCLLRLQSDYRNRYVAEFLRSTCAQRQFRAPQRGIKNSFRLTDTDKLWIPIPPLAEQKRIVAKVDELMALCDRLEGQQQERDEQASALARASLARFAEAPTPANLNLLFHKSYSIAPGELRKSILSLAIRGKLLPQEANERAKIGDLAFLGNAYISDKTGLPGNWLVASLAAIADQIVDCPHSTPKWAPSGKICVRTNQFKPGNLDLSTSRFVSEKTFIERIERLRPRQDDILYSREGGILGVACRVPPEVDLCLGQRIMLIRAKELMDPSYLELVLNSPHITEIARRQTTGGAAPRVNVSTVKSYPIPVPPLAEQRRIVTKVDQLMALVDQLETHLAASRATAKNLLDALVAELTHSN